ncbi:DUF4263 domain-containing protein [Dehalococcoidales bacterium]|nr:DUF4263 domain-containing protein [Dehalococcoidales bacterium]
MRHSGPLYDWRTLNSDARFIIKEVIDKWQALLDNRSATERIYHQFLAEHAGLFFFTDYPGIVISKLRLDLDFETDFVVGIDRNSVGFDYELIEIEVPHMPAVGKYGDYNRRLTHAIRQTLDWQYWLENNWNYAKQYFRHQDSVTQFKYSIYIGRRSDEKQYNARRNWLAKKLGIKIRSFDELTDRLKNRTFKLVPYLVAEWDHLEKGVKNQLMDPFFMAYKFREWKRLKELLPLQSHVVINNANPLLKFRKYNAQREKFIQFWDKQNAGRRGLIERLY